MLTVALNAELTTSTGWIQLLPDTCRIAGIDGRNWLNDQPDSVVSKSRLPMVIDYEHASEHRAPQGLDAPAAGWVDRLQVRGFSVWGHTDWTPHAKQRITSREYRYISPVFTYDRDTGRIHQLISAGLTNKPNLDLKALNHRIEPIPQPDEVINQIHDLQACHPGLSLDDAYERFIHEKAFVCARTRPSGNFDIAFNTAVASLRNAIPKPTVIPALNHGQNVDIQQYQHANPKLSTSDAVARLRMNQACQQATALQRKSGYQISFTEALNRIENHA